VGNVQQANKQKNTLFAEPKKNRRLVSELIRFQIIMAFLLTRLWLIY